MKCAPFNHARISCRILTAHNVRNAHSTHTRRQRSKRTRERTRPGRVADGGKKNSNDSFWHRKYTFQCNVCQCHTATQTRDLRRHNKFSFDGDGVRQSLTAQCLCAIECLCAEHSHKHTHAHTHVHTFKCN